MCCPVPPPVTCRLWQGDRWADHLGEPRASWERTSTLTRPRAWPDPAPPWGRSGGHAEQAVVVVCQVSCLASVHGFASQHEGATMTEDGTGWSLGETQVAPGRVPHSCGDRLQPSCQEAHRVALRPWPGGCLRGPVTSASGGGHFPSVGCRAARFSR